MIDIRTFRRVALGALVVALIAAGSLQGSAAGAATHEQRSFCKAQASVTLDEAILSASPAKAKAARKQIGRLLKAKPPRDVVRALTTLRDAATTSGDEVDADLTLAVTDASATVASFLADKCGGSESGTGGASSSSSCPLTAAQVSAAVGATVNDAGACTFFPSDAILPNVVFVYQVSFACNDGIPRDVGYTETLDGLGTEAYVQREGVQILVCAKRPFEIEVDKGVDKAGALAAAQQLARQVLAGG